MQIGSFDDTPQKEEQAERYGVPEAIVPGIWRIPLPVAFPPRVVNAYVLGDGNSWTLVDCGLGTRESDAALASGLTAIGISVAQLDDLLLTHAHPDHIAPAGDLVKEMHTPRVLMYASEINRYFATWNVHNVADFRAFGAMQMLGGLSREEADAGLRGLLRLASFMRLVPRETTVPLADNEVISLGGREWRVIWTPGHAEGHICLVSGDIVIVGDHVLPQISPNVGFSPQARPDPIQDYLDGLSRLEALQLISPIALPGHGRPFTRLAARIVELRQSSERRSTGVLSVLHDLGEPVNALHVTDTVFAGRLRSGDDRRLALGETMAHLEHLRLQGKITREDRDGVAYYSVI